MTIQIKAAVNAGVDGLVVVAVREDGSRSLPEIIDKVRLVSQVAGTIHRMKCGCDSWGIDRDSITFSLPAELHMVCRYTLFREDMAPMTVLEAIANAANLRPDQIVIEYPPADRAEAALKLSDALRARAIEHAEAWMEKAATARMGLAAAEGWIESHNENMRNAIEEFGLDDAVLSDGSQVPTIDMRLEILLAEMRRLRHCIGEVSVRGKDGLTP